MEAVWYHPKSDTIYISTAYLDLNMTKLFFIMSDGVLSETVIDPVANGYVFFGEL